MPGLPEIWCGGPACEAVSACEDGLRDPSAFARAAALPCSFFCFFWSCSLRDSWPRRRRPGTLFTNHRNSGAG